ncbi:MAG: hypothetical protein DRN30_05390 [Thermoplasmata archaeon]|nr:MAG: hypothetical protein DRN30_05390 [Thermoplasmata archaeon]
MKYNGYEAKRLIPVFRAQKSSRRTLGVIFSRTESTRGSAAIVFYSHMSALGAHQPQPPQDWED